MIKNQGQFLLINSIDPICKDFYRGFLDGRESPDMAFHGPHICNSSDYLWEVIDWNSQMLYCC